MIDILIGALCCSSISFTITTTSMFKWLRELLSPVHEKLEELIHCPWCLSHYVIAVFLLLADVRIHLWTSFFDYMVTLFAMTGISGLCHYVLLRAYEPVAKAALQRRLDKMKKN